MTVAELIKVLEEMPQKANVEVFMEEAWGSAPLTSVETLGNSKDTVYLYAAEEDK